MLKKQVEFAAHYVVNDYISANHLLVASYQKLKSYQAYVSLFLALNSKEFWIFKFNERIETLLTK